MIENIQIEHAEIIEGWISNEEYEPSGEAKEHAEISKNVAIKFAQWMCREGYDSKQILVRPSWSKGIYQGGFSSAELFEEFITKHYNQKFDLIKKNEELVELAKGAEFNENIAFNKNQQLQYKVENLEKDNQLLMTGLLKFGDFDVVDNKTTTNVMDEVNTIIAEALKLID